jgi:hypothetical protein
LAGGVNLYAYAGNNSVSWSDPFGLCKEPQEEGEVTECERLARYADSVAANTKHNGEFILVLGRQLAGFPRGLATLTPGASPTQFGESGFSNSLVDGDGHPARHFTASLVLGYQTDPLIAGLTAIGREVPGLALIGGCKAGCSGPDIALGLKGAELAGLLRNGDISRHDVGAWIRKNL